MSSKISENKSLSIIVPVYNEAKTLETLVRRVLAITLPFNYQIELVLINDGSQDQSWEIMQKLQKEKKGIKILANPENLGKTRTVLNGIKASTGDLLVIQDADLEYNPQEIVEMVQLFETEQLDVVYGNRFGKKNKVIYIGNYIGNRLLSLLSNFFTYPRVKTWIPDMEVCYKLIRGNIARELAMQIVSKSSFGFEPEITAKLSKYKLQGQHLRFGIVSISYQPRTKAEGKHINAISDGFKAIVEVFKFNLN